jgi:hypothetical protein
MAPLIRFTLLGLYLALVLPLPVLAPLALRPLLLAALPLGLGLVLAATSERVELTATELRVAHPGWCRWWLKRGWQLAWSEISGLTAVATSQGGRVYYVRSAATGAAWLLPQRVAHFDDFLDRFARLSGCEVRGIGRISPAWTYRLLAVLCGLMLVAELVALAWIPWPSA